MTNDPVFTGIVVPIEVVRLVDAQREVNVDGKKKVPLNKAVGQYVEQLLADFISQNRLPSVDVGESIVARDVACEVILKHLDADHQRLIRTFAKERKLPIEAFIMSALVRIKDRGETNIVLHEWLQQAPVETASKPDVNIRTCEYCNQQFTAAYDDQRFCPDPVDGSDSCGRKWNMAKIKADIEAHRRPPSKFAPPQSFRVRPTMV